MKKLILTALTIFILGIILTNISCEKLDIKNITKINTGEVSDIGYYSATIQGTIIDVGENVREIGHCWDTISGPGTDKNKQALDDDYNQGTGIYTKMTNLRPGHKYYVRAYALIDNETVYGEETTFETTKLPNFVLSFGFPAINSLWPVGKSRKITWTTDIPGAFKLTLLKFEGGTDVDLREIATTAEGAREYDYVLPADAVTAGEFYAIRVESVDIPDRYNLQGFKATDPAISMILPNANTKWNIKREYNIEWNSTDIDRVDIRLLQNGNWVSDIADEKVNNNAQAWSIPQSLTPGTNYQIKVSYHDFPEIMAVSVNFEILDEASISVTAPVAADDWQAGSTHDITWTDNISENVRIELFKNNTLVTEIAADIPSTSPHSWTLPTTLTVGTDYTIKVSMVVDGSVVGESAQFTVSPEVTTGFVTDYDGNTYNTVKIGNQWWMAENLKTIHYADGTAIPNVTGDAAWAALNDDNVDKAYCWYNDDEATNKASYGALYTWAGAMNGESSSTANPSGIQGACPTGWHLPSDDEWKELEMYLGMSQADADGTYWQGTDEGKKLKEAGNIHWASPSAGTNISGYTALPSGNRSYLDGVSHKVTFEANFWTTTESGTNAYYHLLYHDRADSYRNNNAAKSYGFSVRCVKD